MYILQNLKKWLAIPAISFSLLIAACSMSIKVGRQPDSIALQNSLTVGESTRTDVKSVLGEPFGTGQRMLPFDETAKDLWTYYYEESTLSDSRRIFLWVFFDGDTYIGHMWFSSLTTEPENHNNRK